MNTYHYIIIGAGSAGCVLANRLSANEKTNVLLLEAGKKDNHPNIHIPGAFNKLFKTPYDWNYQTTPQASAGNRKLYLPRGKTLGGCSSTNAMIYIRGNKEDYNEWASLGNKGWSYNDVLPYFKKSEHNEIIQNDYHGSDGLLNVTNRNYTNTLSNIFLDAVQELGYKINSDFNGEKQDGFGQYQVTNKNGTRCSASKAFLSPIAHRKNLHIVTSAMVERIKIENEVATSVMYRENGKSIEAIAMNEIVLSAGAYNSPQILMISGIGDGKELRKHNIPIHKELMGVGKNLQDHYVYFAIFNSTYKNSLDSAERFPYLFKNIFDYLMFKKGPFASNIGEAGGFIKIFDDESIPDTQFHFGPAYFINHGFGNPKTGNGYSIGGKVLRPKSLGTVQLNSAHPNDAPRIDHNYLSHHDDVEKSIRGFKIAQQIGMTDAFKPYRDSVRIPQNILHDHSAIEDVIRNTGVTLYHPTSTCKMGHDGMSVVDDELRVHGIKNLRVVDASIMPTITRGNTNAPTIMIAEKASDLIIHSHKQ